LEVFTDYFARARAFQLVRIKVNCCWDERFVQRAKESECNEVFDRAEAA